MTNKKKVAVFAAAAALTVLIGVSYATRDWWLCKVPFLNRLAAVRVKAGAGEYKYIYTCPMHPQVVKEKPGECPICGMTLIKKPAKPATKAGPPMPGMPGMETPGAKAQVPGTATQGAGTAGLGSVTLDPRQRMLANVATTKVVMKELSQDVNTVGKVAFNEQTLRKITSRYAGRVERLSVNFTGQPVRKGQLILSIYSPDIIATQKEYLIAKRSTAQLAKSDFAEVSRSTEGVMDSARTRLRLWGMTDAQIDALDRTGDIKNTVDVYSPVSGTVVDLKVRQGDYVTEGSEIYTVAELGNVWMLADVYEYEFSKISMGSRAEVTAEAFPGRVFHGRVSFIDPTVNPESRTVKVRVILPNPGGLLKPEMFVNARILSRPVRSVTVPASAILYTGMHNVAWVEVKQGVFVPRNVQLGMRSGDLYQVLSGLDPGEMVVSQGGFLIDSEAQLEESAKGGGGMPGMPGMETGEKAKPKAAPPKEQMPNMPGM